MTTAATIKLADDQAKRVWTLDKEHFVHPWTHFDSFVANGSLAIQEGRGAYICDASGRRYLDGIGGLWCVNIGYGRKELADAIADQALRLPFFNTFKDTTNVPAALLAAKLAELAPPHLAHVFFTCTGSDANDTAVRLAHYYHARRGNRKKKNIISRFDAYHGSTYLGMSLTGREDDKSPNFHFITDFVHHVSCPNTYRRPDGMSLVEFTEFLVQEFKDKIDELDPDTVAAFIAEPIMGAGGVHVPPPDYHQRMRAICRENDILYIADEVVTAFGRLGHFFSSKDVFGIEPDIITTAKGISSGYVPLGATIFSDAIWDVISAPDPSAWFTHGFTYSGHPVACAAGLKNIEIMERERICEHVQEVGPYFQRRLEELRNLPLVGDVRGSHFMLCVENVRNKRTKELVEDDYEAGQRIADHCQANGLIIRPLGHLNVLSPPLILTTEDVDTLVDTLASSIKTTADDLVREGHTIE